jgi:hypothetical protein
MSTTDGQYPDSAKNAFDILDMIHAAEQRQAEIDAYLYEEALKKIKVIKFLTSSVSSSIIYYFVTRCN